MSRSDCRCPTLSPALIEPCAQTWPQDQHWRRGQVPAYWSDCRRGWFHERRMQNGLFRCEREWLRACLPGREKRRSAQKAPVWVDWISLEKAPREWSREIGPEERARLQSEMRERVQVGPCSAWRFPASKRAEEHSERQGREPLERGWQVLATQGQWAEEAVGCLRAKKVRVEVKKVWRSAEAIEGKNPRQLGGPEPA